MDFEKLWKKALKNTEVVRTRIQTLMTFQDTKVPYILLSESSINVGDTVVRTGEILVEKPSIILPPNIPQFEGFEFEETDDDIVADDAVINFLLVRGVTMPSLRYNNTTHSLDLYEGSMNTATKHYSKLLQQQENVHTGLLIGPEDCWQFSLLIFICTQIARNADSDIRNIINKYKNNNT